MSGDTYDNNYGGDKTDPIPVTKERPRVSHQHQSHPCRVCGTTRAHALEDNCEGWPTGEDLRRIADDYEGAAVDEQAIYKAATKIEHLEERIAAFEAAAAKPAVEKPFVRPPGMCVGQVRGGIIDIDDDDD